MQGACAPAESSKGGIAKLALRRAARSAFTLVLDVLVIDAIHLSPQALELLGHNSGGCRLLPGRQNESRMEHDRMD